VTVTNADGSKSVQIVEDKPGQTSRARRNSEGRIVRGLRYAASSGPRPTPDQTIKARAMWEGGRPRSNADAAPMLTGPALDMVANQFAQTGTLPPMGMGKLGAKVRQAIITRGRASSRREHC